MIDYIISLYTKPVIFFSDLDKIVKFICDIGIFILICAALYIIWRLINYFRLIHAKIRLYNIKKRK